MRAIDFSVPLFYSIKLDTGLTCLDVSTIIFKSQKTSDIFVKYDDINLSSFNPSTDRLCAYID